MSTSTWTGAVNSDWDDAGNWSPAGVPDAGSDVTIATGTPLALASASIETVNSITDSSDLSFESAGTNTVATVLDNAGSLHVDDNAGAGGTKLNIGRALTNHHRFTIGNTMLSAPDEVTAASLDNTGSISLIGSSANQALLDVTTGRRGLRHSRGPDRPCSTCRRQRDRVRDRRDHAPRGSRDIAPERKRRLRRGQLGAGVEQRADRARVDRRGGCFRAPQQGRGVDVRLARQ
jgi:hypothetical protein